MVKTVLVLMLQTGWKARSWSMRKNKPKLLAHHSDRHFGLLVSYSKALPLALCVCTHFHWDIVSFSATVSPSFSLITCLGSFEQCSKSPLGWWWDKIGVLLHNILGIIIIHSGNPYYCSQPTRVWNCLEYYLLAYVNGVWPDLPFYYLSREFIWIYHPLLSSKLSYTV